MLLDGELETIAQSDTASVREYVEPASELEKTLCRIWQSVLKRERIGTTDNFLDIGGNSLAAIDITSKIRKHFEASVDLSIDELLTFPTIATLAEYIELKIAHAGSKTLTSAAVDNPRKTVRI
jgi:acyl carrier protein